LFWIVVAGTTVDIGKRNENIGRAKQGFIYFVIVWGIKIGFF